MPELAPLHPVVRSHIQAMSDEIGIMQHASGPRPDPLHGYCTDDVARALQVDLLHQREIGWEPVAESAWRNLRFLEEAFDKTPGRFRNFRNADGAWRAGVASEDSQARAMLALGDAMAAPDDGMAQRARVLFAQALPMAKGVRALRARASVMLALDAAVRIESSQATVAAYDESGEALDSQVRASRDPDLAMARNAGHVRKRATASCLDRGRQLVRYGFDGRDRRPDVGLARRSTDGSSRPLLSDR